MPKQQYGKSLLGEGYAIIPNKVLFSTNIAEKDKLIFCLISSLCAERGYCFATNEYLAEKLDIPARTVRRSLKVLRDKRFILIEEPRSFKRKIYLNEFFKK